MKIKSNSFRSRVNKIVSKKIATAKSKVSKRSIKKAFSLTKEERFLIEKIRNKLPKPDIKKLKEKGKSIDFKRLYK